MRRSGTFFALSFVSLAFFIIAVLGFGFSLRGGRTLDLTDLPKIQASIEGTLVGSGPDYLRTTYGLMVSGLVFAGAAFILGWGSYNASTYDDEYTEANSSSMWCQIMIAFFIVLAMILILCGSMIFMHQYYRDYRDAALVTRFKSFWNVGIMAGLIIFTVLPVIGVIAAFFVRNDRIATIEIENVTV